ncbi:MAG TPA: cytochrome c oxidase subunit 3 [Dehalococcoidia bacterium]|nr:cytochrome c oxidase subunit 3 [Dehalococcoidia bacterium]
MTVRDYAGTPPYPRFVSGSRAPATWGMWLVILTEGIFFALLFSSYLYLRSGATEWPQGGLKAPELLVPSILTVILLSSSIPMAWADMGIRRGNQMAVRAGFGIALTMGVIFLALQIHEYTRLEFRANTNAYASLFVVITAFHGAHLFVGILMNALTQVRAWAGHFTERRNLAVTNVALYWHFVDAVWIFIFLIVYISPHMG